MSALRGGVTRAALREGELGVLGVDELLAPHAALVDRIRVAYGGEEGSFEAQVGPLIRRFAAFVHLLPATRDAHFHGAGGCLQCGLEVGFHALQAADGQIFSARGTVPARRAAAPRWRAAAFATGLCAEAYRPVFGAAVCAEDGAQWSPVLMPLFDWLQRRGCERYVVQWPEQCTAQRAAVLALLPQILGPSLLEFLAEPDRTILDHVVAAIAAPPGAAQNAIGTIVEQTLSRVVARELRRARNSHQSLPTANAVEPVPSNEPPLADCLLAPCAHAPGPGPAETPLDLAMSTGSQPPAFERPPQAEASLQDGEAGALVEDAAASERAPRRRLAVPSTLNPVVADALSSLLSPPPGEPLAAGIEVSSEGVYVPLGLLEQRGLDTGLVVRSLHDARLLVLQGARKVWRKRCGDADVPGLMLSSRLFA